MKRPKIFVWLKEPGRKARHVWISRRLENLQKTVGGYIEAYNVADEVQLLCDEDGKRKNYEPNITFGGHDFVGTLILVGIKDEDFDDCPLTAEQMHKLFPEWMREG